MSQRIKAGLAAVPLLGVLWFAVAIVPLPYVTYTPGPTFDVLGDSEGEPIIEVSGHEVFRDDGELRLTTIYVDEPEARMTLLPILTSWWDSDDAVYPRSAVYQEGTTDEEDDVQSAYAMASSQDMAVAAALRSIGEDVPEAVAVGQVAESMPATGLLKSGDLIRSVAGKPIGEAQDVVDAVRADPAGTAQTWVVERGGRERSIDITTRQVEGAPRVGVTPAASFEFPFEVKLNISESIGGSSAGMMFALSIHDVLTPGSLTDGRVIAGSGEIDADGNVGPIGGVQQKIAASRDAGAELFLVAEANCDSIGDIDTGDMRLARVATLDEALGALEVWTNDTTAPLPTCENG